MSRFCIYCGTTGSEDNPVVNGICLKCMLKRGRLIKLRKKSIRIDICKICYSIKIGYKWFETSGFEDAISSIINNIVPRLLEPSSREQVFFIEKYEFITKASWKTVVRVYVITFFGGIQIEVPLDITIFLNPVKCPRCRMYNSREFEAVVQIRGYPLSYVFQVLEKVFLEDRRLLRDFIESISSHNGVDIYFFTHGAARKLARKLVHILNAHIMETYEEAGMRSGKQRARLYISLKPKA